MKQIQVKWNKVSPAELSSTYSAQYFAFSRNNEVLLVDEIGNDCLFTKIIQTSASYNRSIYDMDIWVGSIESGVNNLNSSFDSTDFMDVLAWSANVQLQEAEKDQIKLKEEENKNISKRTRLRMLASIA
jgi:hypothetical protein